MKTTFNKYQRRFQAKIRTNGEVEVIEASADTILGCVYFSSSTRAYKIARELIRTGLIASKRSGYMSTTKGFIRLSGGYYLGAIITDKQDGAGHTEAARQSELIHGVCATR